MRQTEEERQEKLQEVKNQLLLPSVQGGPGLSSTDCKIQQSNQIEKN